MVIPRFDNIPEELRALRQWVLWRYIRGTKPPFQTNGMLAGSTDPHAWSTFAAVVTAYKRGGFDGIGFVLSAHDPYVAFDFDHCLDSDGNITDDRVTDYVTRLNSYTEVTPSGTGLRVIVRAALPPGGRKRGNLEVYDQARYITLTGHLYGGRTLPIADRQVEVDATHAQIFAPQRQPDAPRPANGTSPTLDDGELLERARGARNGAKFSALYDRGDWQAQGYPSQSEADLALLSMLVFWAGPNEARLDRLFRQSALMRDKWANRSDYRSRTIFEAIIISGCQDSWSCR
jgi:putative DNA primase/helicase